ncbi:unnamed protein product [Aphis gossypii]|uniref:Major facilitator superfamily associated domain-containing protein n=1 Tax=Aphis gossypii TaxID=80765 RepID=A0A9P0NG82_APHGO|nr:unnamed protein product [Aphis gossypii]
MRLPDVNVKLLPIKAHFFLMNGGTTPLTPYLTTIAKQRGYSARLVGAVFSVLPLTAVLARPIFGAVADHYRCQKTMFLSFIVVITLITTSYKFIPDQPVDVSNERDETALTTHQFWLFCFFLVARYVSNSVVTTLSETICLQNLGKDTHKFGQQRLWGCIGWGSVSMMMGWLIDWYSSGSMVKDYTPGIIVSVVFLLADLLVAFKIEDCQSDVVSKHIFKDLKKVFKDNKVVCFLVWVVFFGIFYGSISLYLLWHMEELVTKYHPEKYSSIKTIQGTLIAVKCFGGEAPFFFLSGKIIKKVGHLNSIVIGLATLSLRFFLYYIIKDPVWVVPVEILSGLGFALPYTAMTAYGSMLAPEGLKSTVQGLFSTFFQGVGVSLGSLITGYLFNELGSSYTYLVLSILALVVCCIQTLTIRIMAKTTKLQDNSNVNTEA